MARSIKTQLPYPPSPQNRFFNWVDRLPVPNLLTHLLVALVAVLPMYVAPWIDGRLPWGQFDINHLFIEFWLPVGLVTLDILLSYSKVAMARFRPALLVSNQEFAQLSYSLTNLSSRTGWLIVLAAVIFALAFDPLINFVPDYFGSGLSRLALYMQEIIQATLFYTLVVFVLKVCLKIRDLYGMVRSINLFHLEPLYAFSGFTSRVGLYFIFQVTVGYTFGVILTHHELGWFINFIGLSSLAIAVAAFVWPLGGMHSRLQKEKERVSAVNDLRIEKAYKELHRRMDQKKTAGLSDFRSGLAAMLDLRQEIKKISTWPWETATLRTFIAALLVPMTAWLIQQVLLRTMGR